MPYESCPIADELKTLTHDFANDINSLKMNLQILEFSREDAEEHAKLIQVMNDTVATLQQRIEGTFELIRERMDSP